MNEVLETLKKIEAKLEVLIEQRRVQEWYDTKTVGEILGKSQYSVREWCRLGRVHAKKRMCGRGNHPEWMISHEELERIKAEGLLPLQRGVS